MGSCMGVKKNINDLFSNILQTQKIHLDIIKPCWEEENLFVIDSKDQPPNAKLTILSKTLFRKKNSPEVSKQIADKILKFEADNGTTKEDSPIKKRLPKMKEEGEYWFILKENLFYNYRISLSNGDMIKIGRLFFSIIEVHIENPEKFVDSAPIKEKPKKKSRKSSQKETKIDAGSIKKNACKYCLEEEDDPTNPLISPCKCKGTMGFVHAKCMFKWILEKVKHIKNDYIIIFSWEQILCDVCHAPIETLIQKGDQKIDLFKWENPQFSFLEMETQIEKIHYRFFINFDKKTSLKIGSCTECEIRLLESTISGYHCKIYTENDEIFVEDLGSKYGTLLLLNDLTLLENLLSENGELCLLYEDVILKFSVQ